MAFEFRSASTTLDDIINELKLTYDSSIGLLDGDSIRKIPNVNILLNLNKLLNNLSKELYDVEQTDDSILKKIDSILQNKLSYEIKAESSDKAVDSRDGNKIIEESTKNTKRLAATELDELDELDEEDESINLSKRRKLNSLANVKVEDDEEVYQDNKDEIGTSHNENISSVELVPPVQTGSYTQENDTRLKNPKSEFVTSQTLSANTIAELGLFSEENNGLETQGKEYLKKKYGVSSYPERDLQCLLPGKIPDIDFSKNKPPTSQVQFTTFQSYIESYFRPYSNDDLDFLNEKNIIPPGFEKSNYDPDVSPFIIPKLGPFYADVWAEEDATLGSKLNSPAYQQSSLESYKPKGSIDTLNDDNLFTEEVSCGPLSSRLLSAILSNHEIETNEEDDKNTEDNINADDNVATHLNSSEDYKISTESNDFHSIEERLKRELKYIGIFMNLPGSDDESKNRAKINGRLIKKGNGSIIDSDEWIKNKEDDEVCAEIRALQKELKEAVQRNRRNKKKLIPFVEEQIAYQEYCTILEDLDKQVDQAFMKRSKVKNKKKKVETTTAQQQAVNSGLRALLDKRKRWINNIGKLFKPTEIMKRVPKESVLKSDDSENQDVDEEENEDNSTSAESIIPK